MLQYLAQCVLVTVYTVCEASVCSTVVQLLAQVRALREFASYQFLLLCCNTAGAVSSETSVASR